MPEFILNDHAQAERAESPFVLGFIEAMFFTESDSSIGAVDWFGDDVQVDLIEGRLDGGLPCDVGYSDIHPDSLAAIRTYCGKFIAANSALLAEAYSRPDYDEAQAGRDLWFTVNGHGVGFWDREALEPQGEEWKATQIPCDRWTPEISATRERLKAESLGERLSKACGRGEINPFFGDHLTHGSAPFVHVDF
jgi:hypothetical protein